jgi:hypothetical protein
MRVTEHGCHDGTAREIARCLPGRAELEHRGRASKGYGFLVRDNGGEDVRNVRLWHKADILIALCNVRFRR